MKYKFTKEDIYSLPFDEYFKPYFKAISDETPDKKEFFEKGERQHYRLLSYFSTLFNNSVIIDIGTNRGQSGLALSFNETNIIHTFDILDKVTNPDIKEKNNICFHMDNLFEESGQEKWKDTILNSPFIFLDVDPHNGFMEKDFYNFLKSINYQGFVICDDIWHFKEMRDNFWYKLPYEERYDLTEFGHFSGTGIFTFNKEIEFYKPDNSNWTLVTAYFNLTKCPDSTNEIMNRGQYYYLNHSFSTLHLPYNLVIYCDNDSIDLIKKIRPKCLADKTHYIVREFDEMRFTKNGSKLSENFGNYRDKINDNRSKNPYNFDNRNTASYYLFCMSRYIMLKEVITENKFNSSHFCWINFCIERMGYTNVMHLDEALAVNRDKFSTCYIDYIPHELIKNTSEYFKWGRCSMCSGFFTGNADYMYNVCDLIENKFLQYLEEGYGHADEQLYSPVFFENPDMFEQYYGDYQQMITNYKYIYENPDAPVYNFIKKSFDNKDYLLCKRGCEFLWKSYCEGKYDTSVDSVKWLCYYYMMCNK